MSLYIGIKIDTLIVGKYQVNGLYIKLDKKLTLQVKQLIIPQEKENPSFQSIDKTFDKIKHIFTFFNYIELEKVHFDNNELHIIFVEDILYIRTKDYEIAGNIRKENNTLVAEISTLHIKKENIQIKGQLTYFLSSEKLMTQGSFSAYKIEGAFKVKKIKDKLFFSLSTESFTSLKPLIHGLSLKKKTKSWILDKVQAKTYKVHHLEGTGSITAEGFNLHKKSIKGTMDLSDVHIKYHKDAPVVDVDTVLFRYLEGTLYIDLEKPSYLKRSMEGSYITLKGLGKKDLTLHLSLQMKTAIDKKFNYILKAYKRNIPFLYEGMTDIAFNMLIPLNKKKKKKIDVKIHFNQGILKIGKVHLPIKSGDLTYKEKKITLKNIHLKEKKYEFKVNGQVDTKVKKANLQVKVEKLILGKNPKYFSMYKKSLKVKVSYKKSLKISIPSLALDFIKKKSSIISINKIAKIKPYLKNIGIELDKGKVIVKTKDFKTYTFSGILLRPACFFYGKKEKCYTRIPYQGKINSKGLVFDAFKKSLSFNSSRSRIDIKNMNVDLKKLLLALSNKTTKIKAKKTLVIVGKNSELRYNEYKLKTDEYNIKIRPNGDIKAIGSLEGDFVHFSKEKDKFSLKAVQVNDKMLHPLLQFDGIKGGSYTIEKRGHPDRVMYGKILIEGGILGEFKAYNNTLAFLNTLPALATLSNPGFSKKGFEIKDANIMYHMTKDKVILDSIYIKGASVTIVGKGSIDLKNKKINIDLALRTARELGKVLGSIPILGYILMGEDKSLTIGLTIRGDLDQPKVETSAAKEILNLPIDLVKRILNTPKVILNSKK